MKLRLEQTCGACPEQYNAYTPEGEKIGYLRLRHGYFYADYTPTGETVFDCYPLGDGCFESEERDRYLNEACKALVNQHLYHGSEKETFYY